MKLNKEIIKSLILDIRASNLALMDRIFLNSMLLEKLNELENPENILKDYPTDIEDELDEHNFQY